MTKDEFIMEGIAVTPTQAPVQFHVECFYVWDQERRVLPAKGAASPRPVEQRDRNELGHEDDATKGLPGRPRSRSSSTAAKVK